MKVGTKSILFGYHQFLIHPLFVALAWWRLYGFPWDVRLWAAFFLHDIGYWGKPNMDGPEGESHPFEGAGVMGQLFDYRDSFGHKSWQRSGWWTRLISGICDFIFGRGIQESLMGVPSPTTWYCFTFYHSRFLCKSYNIQPSRLCYADKYCIVIMPTWLQLGLMNLTGEIHEYMKGKDGRTSGAGKTQRAWCAEMKKVLRQFLEENKP